jgi:hydroxymethylpyrimidine/phosphomethylpyrimidine kinase
VDAVKTGMLGDAETIDAVVEALGHTGEAPLVVDPVMVAESGSVLLDPAARTALVERILPLAAVATPNLPEAHELTGLGPGASAEELARAVCALGPKVAVVTGGHGEAGDDVFFDGAVIETISGPRHPPGASHGSGCTHSAVLAAQLALGLAPLEAARRARALASEAVGAGLRDLGSGPGPVDVLGIAGRRDRAEGGRRE